MSDIETKISYQADIQDDGSVILHKWTTRTPRSGRGREYAKQERDATEYRFDNAQDAAQAAIAIVDGLAFSLGAVIHGQDVGGMHFREDGYDILGNKIGRES